MGFNIGIVGVTGAVGQEMLRVLDIRKFPIKNLRCFASPRSLGKKISFQNTSIEIEELKEGCFKGLDIVLFSAGKNISLIHVPKAIEEGCFVVDNSSAFRLDPEVPLIIPEINAHALGNKRLVASPNCTASILLMALAPLHKRFKIKRIVGATYQAASGAGYKAMEELKEETQAVLSQKDYGRSVFPYQYAFNLFSHNSAMTASGYNEEEHKVIEESRKILDEMELPISMTCVRVPILRAHSIALNVEFHSRATSSEAQEILEKVPGVKVLVDRFPMPIDATGQDEIFVGRIREDRSQPHTLDLWVVGDQLLKGAALNAIQIAELIGRKTTSLDAAGGL